MTLQNKKKLKLAIRFVESVTKKKVVLKEDIEGFDFEDDGSDLDSDEEFQKESSAVRLQRYMQEIQDEYSNVSVELTELQDLLTKGGINFKLKGQIVGNPIVYIVFNKNGKLNVDLKNFIDDDTSPSETAGVIYLFGEKDNVTIKADKADDFINAVSEELSGLKNLAEKLAESTFESLGDFLSDLNIEHTNDDDNMYGFEIRPALSKQKIMFIAKKFRNIKLKLDSSKLFLAVKNTGFIK